MNNQSKTKKQKLTKIVLTGLLGLALNQGNAQIKDCNAFIQGNYVEVGVNYNGAYGTAAAPPAGYHARGHGWAFNKITCHVDTGKGLGFVVDPAKDGWGDSTAPARAYYGDYFFPGIVQEGWSIMTDTQVNCWNISSNLGLPFGMTGDNTRHFSSGSKRVTVWDGVYDSLQISQRTIVDTANTYFVIRVKITNMAARPRYNVYYMRTVEPDNEYNVTGGFVTFNNIDLQLPNPSNRTLVSAKGITHPDSYLGMATKDLRAKSFIIKNVWGYSTTEMLHPTDRIDSIYNTVPSKYMYAEKDSLTDDVGIGIVYKIDSLPAADSTIILMAYMFKGSDIDSAVNDLGEIPAEATSIFAKKQNDFNIFLAPNPFNNTLSLKGVLETDKVILYDIYGKTINLKWENSGNELLANTAGLANGIYILRIVDAKGLVKYKQTIQHD